jgi:hypothetical protein
VALLYTHVDPSYFRGGQIRDSIRITQALGTQVILLPFFGKWSLDTHAEKDYTGDALRDLGPEAEKAGVILGLENTISTEDNAHLGSGALESRAGLITTSATRPIADSTWSRKFGGSGSRAFFLGRLVAERHHLSPAKLRAQHG